MIGHDVTPIRCVHIHPTKGEVVLTSIKALGEAFALHQYGSLNLEEIASEPDKPYDAFRIKRVVQVVDLIDDPRGVTKKVVATREIRAGEIIGIYEGTYRSNFEDETIDDETILNAYERQYK
ncbi:hypothetical protein HDU98_000187, partial [Podochytrium sp. JEL0797]